MHTTTDGSTPHPTIRVLHLTISFARGGRRDAIVTLAGASRLLGVLPYLATLRGGGKEDSAAAAAGFEEVRDLGIKGLPSYRDIAGLKEFCITRGINVVHAHDASSQFVASMLRVVAPRLQVIMTFHRSLGIESYGLRNRIRNSVSLLNVARVITASTERREYFLRRNSIPSRKVVEVPLGIDLGRFNPDSSARADIRAEYGIAPDERLIVSVGHFGPEKGLDVAVDAVALARKTLADRGIGLRHLHLGAGDPAREEWIREKITQTNGAATALVGYRTDPERFFAAADLLLHTPRLEAFGLVLVQAMASGTPVVATAVGGIPEIVSPEVGQLAPSEDPAAIADAVVGILGDPARLGAASVAALSRAASGYGSARYAERHRAIYDEILGS